MPERPAELYHFSEDPSLTHFAPRPSTVVPCEVVWAIDPAMSHLYFFQRECPRVTFYASEATTAEDRERFLGQTTARYVAAIEAAWLARMRETRLYRYVFAPEGFELEDANAGHWVSRTAVTPLRVELVGDLLQAHADAGVELRILPSLWPLYEAVIASSLGFSIIRWRNVSLHPQERASV